MIDKYYTDTFDIQELAVIDNGFGGSVESWVTINTLQGKMRALQGDERLSADKVTVYATHRLYCPVVSVNESNRIVYENKIYDIKFINNPMGFDRFLQLDLEYTGEVV